MDIDRAFLVICLTMAAVIALNVMIYLSLRRGNEVTTIDLMRKAARRARNPWKDEDDALKELANLVSELKSDTQEPTATDEPANGG
jgi:arginyl-tRNA synthetase